MTDTEVSSNHKTLTKQELAAVLPLASVISLRMFGLFLLLPVLAPFVLSLPGGNFILVGLAVGAYGFTQALALIPLGWLSDVIGRKPVIVSGMILFAIGGFVASIESPTAIIIGRVIQGAGAISAVVLAAISDLIDSNRRSQAMAIVGLGIALAFGISVVAAGPIASGIGVANLLGLTGVLGVVGAIIALVTKFAKPAPIKPKTKRVALRPIILPCLSVMSIHAALALAFVLLPIELAKQLAIGDYWQVYLPAFIFSMLLATPLIIFADRVSIILPITLAMLAAVLPLLVYSPQYGLIVIAIALTGFFTVFNALEAILPANTAKLINNQARGTGMGVFAMFQALGVFIGGLFAGVASQHSYGIISVGLISLALSGCGLKYIFIKRKKT